MKSLLYSILITVPIFLLTGIPASRAQERSATDTLAESLDKVRTEIGLMKKLRITGYVQAQWQKAQQEGISSFSGGNFPANADNRFSIRRGRIKFAYDNDFSNYVLQIDVTEKGVGIKDAYASFTEPWARMFTMTAGVFDRPYGFEISYSSSNRETPERSRIYQTLFPGERELGAKLTFQPPKSSSWNFLRLDAGIFNGSGPTAIDFDGYKDFIGHLMINRSNSSEKFKYGIGVSYYGGGWRQGTDHNYKVEEVFDKDGQAIKAFAIDSTSSAGGDRLKRQYMGADAQLTFDFPFGITQIRGEYLFGTQPGTSSTTVSPSAQPTSNPAEPFTTVAITDTLGNILGYSTVANGAVNSDAYLRKFSGFYFYLVQNIFQTKHQFILKYDHYDPNTKVKGNEIGSKGAGLTEGAKATSATDLAYGTLGLGWAYRWNSHVKITAYYEFVKNETSENLASTNALKDFSSDIRDNVFTLRLQYKF